MYSAHFGLGALPFENVPDPAFFFNEGDFQRVLARVSDAVAAGRGLVVVVGPIGSGKTTLSQKLLTDLPEGTVHLWFAEPAASDRDLLRMLCVRLGVPSDWESRVQALDALREHLLALNSAGRRVLLVVDESHKFTDEGLEAIRLLNNLEQGAAKLIQILMLGQEEMLAFLSAPAHTAFRQRIANLEVLGRMTPAQVKGYIRHRLRVAGGDASLFPDFLQGAIAEAGGGIPRLTNALCDRALLHAFEDGKPAIDQKDLLSAAEDVGVYRKAFHYVVGRDEQPASPGAPDVAGPVATRQSAPAAGPPVIAPRRSLTGPLFALATGSATLAGSLLFYCTRAREVCGDGCIACLLRDLLP